MDHRLIKKIGVQLQSVSSFPVTVANGETLKAQHMCKGLNWEMQGSQHSTDFFVLPLRGCDVVLGLQWLVTLGPIP